MKKKTVFNHRYYNCWGKGQWTHKSLGIKRVQRGIWAKDQSLKIACNFYTSEKMIKHYSQLCIANIRRAKLWRKCNQPFLELLKIWMPEAGNSEVKPGHQLSPECLQHQRESKWRSKGSFPGARKRSVRWKRGVTTASALLVWLRSLSFSSVLL